MSVIEVKGLSKKFKSYERGHGFVEAVKSLFWRKKKVTKAVRNISFRIEKGEIVGFLGPNGAGKSTTLKILSGIMYPDGGVVKVLGYTPWSDRIKYVRNIGAVFGQKSQLFWDLPPIDAFYVHKGVYSMDSNLFENQLSMLTKMLGVEDLMKKPARQLSLGERMRCEFVKAMLHNPKIVFLDEPTIGLDVFAKEKIRIFIKQMNEERGVTFIVTSHDLEDIEHVCSRVIIINEGRIVFDNPSSKLRPSYKKYVSLTFYQSVNPNDFESIPGVRVLQVISDRSVKLAINTAKISLARLIKRIGKSVEDVDISNPPIKELIKKFYK